MAPPYCEKIREICHTKTRQKQSHTYRIRLRQTKSAINSHAKMTLILLLPASRHDKHDTDNKTKHTTHPAPSNVSTTTHHSSRSTAAPMSSLPLPPHFCSAMIVVASLLRCAIQSAVAGIGSYCTFLPALHPSLSTRTTHHLPTNITTPGLTALCCWLRFFYRESFATTHRI